MKKIKLSTALLLLAALASSAQTNTPTFIKGSIEIKYNSRATDPPAKGVKDVYTLNVNVANSALFHGTIADTPQLIEGMFSKSVTQPRKLDYDISLDVVNPKNAAQTKNVGRMYGAVPISPDGTYHYDAGSLTVDILPMGNAGGFTSKFGGMAVGKPLGRPAGWLESLKRETVNITRSVNGKTMTVALKKYDKMEFRQLTLAAGPVQIYPTSTVNGDLFYDYDKNCWLFNNVNVQYADGGMIRNDRLTGIIRWIESPQRKANGEGQYEFDVRVNEPPVSMDAAFSAKATDESSFFETDTSFPALSGTMKYKDTFKPGTDTTLSSSVAIDLAGNNITKQQAMVLCKVVMFAMVVPMNSD